MRADILSIRDKDFISSTFTTVHIAALLWYSSVRIHCRSPSILGFCLHSLRDLPLASSFGSCLTNRAVSSRLSSLNVKRGSLKRGAIATKERWS